MAAASTDTNAVRFGKNCDPELYRIQTDVMVSLTHLSTGITDVDAVLPGGGVPLHHVVEVVGPPASGKTRLCCAACVTAADVGEVLFIETRGADVSQQLRQTVGPERAAEVLPNIVIADVHTMEGLVSILSDLLERGLADTAGATRLPLRLLVVDCFADLAVPRVHAHPRETGLVCAATRLLAQVAQQLGCCVMTTNTTVRGEGAELHKAALRATTGPSAPQLRVLMQRQGSDHFCAQVIDSVDHAVAIT